MSQALPARRRWFQFSSGAMLLAVTVLAVFIAYHVNWIRQRRGYETQDYLLNIAGPGHGPDIAVPAPGLLWLFGENGHFAVNMTFHSEDGHLQSGLAAEEEEEVAKAKRLFPEAHIFWRNDKKRK
jgi:hypothetical protein